MGMLGSNARLATSAPPSKERIRKKGANLRNPYQANGVGGSSAALAVTASNTAGTPIHQDDAAPSLRTHQMSENRNPRDTMVRQLVLSLTGFMRRYHRARSARPCIRACRWIVAHGSEGLGHGPRQWSGSLRHHRGNLSQQPLGRLAGGIRIRDHHQVGARLLQSGNLTVAMGGYGNPARIA